MNRLKKSVVALLTLLIMLFFTVTPTNAKQVHHHHTHVSTGLQIKFYHHKKHKVPKPQFSRQDFDDINNDRQANGLNKLSNNKALQKIAIDRVTLAYEAWENGWNSHGSDGKTATAAQLGYNTDSKDYSPYIALISENNARSSISSIPATSSMVDGKINTFPPRDVSIPINIINTNNDIYMNHDVGTDGHSGHRANILDTGMNAVGTAIYHKNGIYVQDEVFGYVE